MEKINKIKLHTHDHSKHTKLKTLNFGQLPTQMANPKTQIISHDPFKIKIDRC